MDIVKYINQHTENLKNGLNNSSPEQVKSLKIATLMFYFQLPDFEGVIHKYVEIDIDKNQLISDIINENVKSYQNATEKTKAAIDEYSDDYEEPEPTEIFILDAFENAISDLGNTESALGLFIGIIDTLDYYENFSEEPDYWNELLEKEVKFQNEILTALKSKDTFDTSIYLKQYKDVKFEEL